MRLKRKGEAGFRFPRSETGRLLLRLLCYIIAGLVGLGLILYPIISNSLYDARQDGVLEEYQAQAETAQTEAERIALLETARQYNRQLETGILSLQDPFLTPTVVDEDGSRRSLLDVTGTGVIATLDIPALSLTLPVYYGTEAETLEKGIGVLEISSLPVGGKGTHTVLCGHSGLSTAKLFSDLELLKEGDWFSVNVMGDTLTYMVDQITTVLPEDLSQLEIDPEQDYCTLLTCTPFGINTHRLLVRGTRMETSEPLQETEEKTAESPVQSVWVKEYLKSLVIGLVVVLLVIVMICVISSVRKGRRA